MSTAGGGAPGGGGFTVVMVARVPPAAREAFDGYEARVLALLPDHGGRLQRRLTVADGSVEVHVAWFPDRAAYDAYRADPRRAAIAPDPETLGVDVEVHEVHDVPVTPAPRRTPPPGG